jgi:hypothetical protein
VDTYNLKKNAAETGSGEFVFGLEHTGSHACYMIYGVLKPGEAQRLIKPGKGHEEMVLSIKGDLQVSGQFNGRLKEGHAFHIAEEDSVYLHNKEQESAFYVIAGGHSQSGHHH